MRRDLDTQLAWRKADASKIPSHVEAHTSLTHPVHWARLAALLTAFFGLATVRADNGYPSELLIVLALGTGHLP